MVEQGSDPLGNLDLDGIFADIAIGNFGLDVLPQPQEQSPIKLGPKATFIAGCIASVLTPKDLIFLTREHMDIRLIAEYFRKEFMQWKTFNIQTSLAAAKDEQAEIIRSLTYADMSEFAKGRFDEFSKESGNAVPFSENQKHMQGLADYWGWMEQVITEADEQEKKKPT